MSRRRQIFSRSHRLHPVPVTDAAVKDALRRRSDHGCRRHGNEATGVATAKRDGGAKVRLSRPRPRCDLADLRLPGREPRRVHRLQPLPAVQPQRPLGRDTSSDQHRSRVDDVTVTFRGLGAPSETAMSWAMPEWLRSGTAMARPGGSDASSDVVHDRTDVVLADHEPGDRPGDRDEGDEQQPRCL